MPSLAHRWPTFRTLTTVLACPAFFCSYRMLSYAIQVVRLQSGHALYEQGEVADSFYLVLNGRLRSVYQQTTSGSRKIVCE
jgi:CRP-like cAMP-binding protein